MAAPSLPQVEKVKLGSKGLEVSKQGLGCMGMSAFYGPPKPESDMVALLHRAFELGVTFWDTADVYGPHTNEVLLGKALKGVDRSKVQLATKFALSVEDGKMVSRGDPAYVRACCEDSLKRLDVDYIDLYYQHRVDKNVPIEITVGEMKKLVEEGKVKYLGLSEASAETIRRAHAIHPITAVQLEWSLWARDAEKTIIPTCRELGIGIVAYSPLGRGVFGGKGVTEELDAGDWRGVLDRFKDKQARNKAFYDRLTALGQPKGATPAQMALAWVQHQGPDVVPIPGTTRIPKLEENIAALGITLSPGEVDALAAAVPESEVQETRYNEQGMSIVGENANTPPLESWKA